MTVQARFLVTDTFDLPELRQFVLVGDVIEGIARPGMNLLPTLAFPPGLKRHICGVEMLCNTAKKTQKIGLRIPYNSLSEAETWKTLDLSGMELTLDETDTA